MKKLKKLHVILIILCVGVVAVSAYFMSSYQKSEAKQPDIMDEITLALMRLEVVKEENDPTEFEQELADLQSEIDMLRLSQSQSEPLFPRQPATVRIQDLVVDSAEKLNLELRSLSSSDKAGTVTIGSNKYNKAQYEVQVKGELSWINSLIGEMEFADFATLTIEDMRIEFYPEELKEERVIPAWWEGAFTIVTLYQYEE